jgi:hypothetical protein
MLGIDGLGMLGIDALPTDPLVLLNNLLALAMFAVILSIPAKN